MAGLFDGFEGYRIPTEADKRLALTTALVAVDANVLLNLYHYNKRTTDDLLTIFARLGDRLMVPHQAMREFHRNRIKAIGNPAQATQNVLGLLEKSRNGARNALDTWSKQIALDGGDLTRLHEDIDHLFEELCATVEQATPDRVHAATPSTEDGILVRLGEIVRGKVLLRPEPATWDELIAEGKRRIDDLVPPGYMDAEKSDQYPEGGAGDYLVYAQSCHAASGRQMDLVIVTSDLKEDWWWRREGDMIGPRQEMTKEFFDRTGHHLFLMQPSDLLDLAGSLDVEVNPESAEDAGARRYEIDDLEVGSWNSEAVDLLLQRLRSEGRNDLVEIITEAARQGGTISRDEIYAFGHYQGDRMLRGFTRPTARITADLQKAKVLPPYVTPMLTSLYRDAGPLSGVRIPVEVVELINGLPGDEG
jgi:hypothetical protein